MTKTLPFLAFLCYTVCVYLPVTSELHYLRQEKPLFACKRNDKEAENSMKRIWVVVVNVIIMIAMPIFVVLYSGFENSNATQMQIERFENTKSRRYTLPRMISKASRASATFCMIKQTAICYTVFERHSV